MSGVKNGAYVFAALLLGALLIGVVPSQMDRLFAPRIMLNSKAEEKQGAVEGTSVTTSKDKTLAPTMNFTAKSTPFTPPDGSYSVTVEPSTGDVVELKTSVANVTNGEAVTASGRGFTHEPTVVEKLLSDASYYYMLLVSIMVAAVVYVFARIRSS